jgi:multidrug efflux pump subunit AcrB
MIAKIHNTSRFCVEHRQIAWVLLVGTVLWGIFGYLKMPQRKDPDMPPKQAKVFTPWPGASAEKVEQLVTRIIERDAIPIVRKQSVFDASITCITW